MLRLEGEPQVPPCTEQCRFSEQRLLLIAGRVSVGGGALDGRHYRCDCCPVRGCSEVEAASLFQVRAAIELEDVTSV